MKSMIVLTLMIFTISCSSTSTRESTGQYIDSAGITTKVKAVLAKDKEVKSLGINVDTYKNTVQLSGFVDSEDQKVRAEKLTKGVKGVKEVINNIEVKKKL